MRDVLLAVASMVFAALIVRFGQMGLDIAGHPKAVSFIKVLAGAG